MIILIWLLDYLPMIIIGLFIIYFIRLEIVFRKRMKTLDEISEINDEEIKNGKIKDWVYRMNWYAKLPSATSVAIQFWKYPTMKVFSVESCDIEKEKQISKERLEIELVVENFKK